MNKQRFVAYTAVAAAVISVLSLVNIPVFGVPLTFQCFAVALCSYICGAKLGVAATAVYILLGAVGLPLFSGFKGGVHVLFDYTGGYIWGFFAVALLCGLTANKGKWLSLAMGTAALLICYCLGILQFSFISGTALNSALSTSLVLFFVKDAVLLAVSKSVAMQIRKTSENGKIFFDKK